MNFVPCIKWVTSGVAKSNPEKIKLSPDELKRLIAEERQQEKEEEEDEGEEQDEYKMRDYDKEEDATVSGAMGLGSVAVLDDDDMSLPTQINQHKIKLDESDSEIDNEIIRKDDNLLLVGHVQDEMSILEVYVYNHESKDFYVHHDILLPSVPLCFEWLSYDPGSTETGNLCAIGDLGPIIKVWDLDIIDCLKPAFTLGKKKKEPKKGYKHTDAVLDIAWNKNAAHVLASGSVDNTILLWDLDESVATTQMSHSKDKVQMLKWHPHESHTLLTGSSDKRVRIYDCRTYDSFMTWKVKGEVEKGIWNASCPFSCFVGTSEGYLYNIDVRNKKPVWEMKSFDKEVTGLYVTEHIPDRLYACSNEEVLKVFENLTDEPKLSSQKQVNIGEVMCLEGNPNHHSMIAMGGTKRCKNLTLLNIETAFIKKETKSDEDIVDNEDDDEEEEESDIDDVEEFFGLKSNTKKQSKKKKFASSEPVEPFQPTPFSHLDQCFVKTKDPSLIKQRKFVKKQKKNEKSIDRIKKKKKQEKMQRNQEKLRKNKQK
ncbi:periodic tryptophan protein 1 homolog isoform X1 [Diaphorina citri]|uniref:Periodic tryptophan protein 1 homolog isoform X1 n=2 Tax=Diaphorina citri TaxID=121845 RepID=A0A3Q0IWA1_DIACI|nr:periodic tryptophan protein 1 homolog isoform X1 [Diaphorina citri]